MTPRRRVLILGGTTEGRALARACAAEPALEVVTSLAGRTSDPLPIPGEVRTGGFGGVPGLVGYLRERQVDAVVDATHPFAATMTAHAVAATKQAGVPLVVLRRSGWQERPGDRWHRVASLDEAAAILPGLGSRVFLTTGRQGIAAFAAAGGCWFLARSVEPPAPPVPARLEVLLDRGPFTLGGECELMRRHRIDVVVTKDSGGPAPKLDAARELGLPVVVVDRPAAPPVDTVATVAQAVTWLTTPSAGRPFDHDV